MIDRLTGWTAAVWPLVFLMIRSKVKYLKALGIACLPAAIFTIVEPVVFGLPLALNPFLFVPFLVVTAVSSTVGYLMMQFGFVARFYASLPWATPPFLLGPLGTGDWKSIIIVVVSFVIGLVIYFPFWRQFEKSCLEKEKAKEAESKGVSAN
jgi:PTS system cellobiose-specific IIC component